MTISTETVSVLREGDGATYSFSFPFSISASTELEVYFVDSAGTATELVEGTGASNFSIDITSYPGAGNVIYPADEISTEVAAGEYVFIARNTSKIQPNSLRTQGGFNPKVHEAIYDRFSKVDLEQQEELDRAAKVPRQTGFVGLAGASPIVNATEDGFRWAVGFEGPAGADGAAGAAGSPGPAGPWKYLGSYDLTGLSTKDITDLGDSTIIALMFDFQGITVSTDDARVSMRVTKNSTTKTAATYHNANFGLTSSDSSNVVGTEVASSLQFLGFDTAWGLGNAATEIADARVYVTQPHTARLHQFYWQSVYCNQTPRQIAQFGSGRWVGADDTSALDGINIFPSAGTIASGTVYVYGLLAENPQVPVGLTGFVNGATTASQVLMRYVATDAFDIAADFALSQLKGTVAATGSTVFTVEKNAVEVGDITVAAAGTSGTFDSGALAISVAAGDVITLTGPATPDATFANISWNIRGLAPIV